MYLARENEIVPEENASVFRLGKHQISFPNRYAFAYTSYHRARVANAPMPEIYKRVSEVWIYIQQAYAGLMVEPGPAPFSKIHLLTAERDQLRRDVNDLNKKLQECETKRKWGITDDSSPLTGDLSKP